MLRRGKLRTIRKNIYWRKREDSEMLAMLEEVRAEEDEAEAGWNGWTVPKHGNLEWGRLIGKITETGI